ncbi:hypothetical protein HOY80DRAFT_714013 [Tuber brumale]|nr:hypothetical protein HOY80DRAFT_714013 [Tuber brumale]
MLSLSCLFSVCSGKLLQSTTPAAISQCAQCKSLFPPPPFFTYAITHTADHTQAFISSTLDPLLYIRQQGLLSNHPIAIIVEGHEGL